MHGLVRVVFLIGLAVATPTMAQTAAAPDPEQAASQAVIGKLNIYVALLNRTLRASESVARYDSWVDRRTGPTGRERIIYGLYSLHDVRSEIQKARTAALYDLLCGEVWPRITKRLPQAINDRNDAANLQGFDWQALARSVGLSPARTLRRVHELCALVISKASKAPEARDRVASMPAGDHPLTKAIVRAIQKRCERIGRQLVVLRASSQGDS